MKFDIAVLSPCYCSRVWQSSPCSPGSGYLVSPFLPSGGPSNAAQTSNRAPPPLAGAPTAGEFLVNLCAGEHLSDLTGNLTQ